MGIQGLLPLLKSVMVPMHIKELKGCSVAVDTYSWLHKGALSCSTDLCKGLPTSRYIDYCMHRVNLLRHYGIKPILVFDGGYLPMKKEQENKRERSRKENLDRANEHERNGNSAAAYECYQKAVDISPAIAFQLIQVLRKENVDYIVAPYEADAQMTFLALNKHVEAVITEDSDLIPFGCPRIIFKMDKYGQGVEFQYSTLQKNREISFAGFTEQMVLEMCILSGCDYLQSLPGMGLKKAHALVRKFKSIDNVIKHLRYSTAAVPPLYEESFKQAIWTFKYQRVYDPNVDDIVHLSEISDDIVGDLDFLGPSMSQHLVKAIARGEVDPITKQRFEEKNVSAAPQVDRSYELKEFKPDHMKRKIDLPAQKNLLTNYFCLTSLEAKRNFRAPRASPKALEETPPCLRPELADNTTAFERNSSPVSLFDLVSSADSADTDHIPQADTDHIPLKDKEAPVTPLFGLEESPKQDMSLRLQLSTKDSHPQLKCEENETSKSIIRSSYFKTVDENAPDHTSGKVVVRSSYFKKNLRRVNDVNKENNNTIHNGGGLSEPESSSDKNDYCENLHTKRKASELKFAELDQPAKKIRIEAPIPDEIDNSSADEAVKLCKGKLGCDISHLDRYSEISEKSLEKFSSVISSFRFNSSGSRASGLRAPLRDVQNIVSDRSPTVADISTFSYVPNSKKVTVASRRRRS